MSDDLDDLLDSSAALGASVTHAMAAWLEHEAHVAAPAAQTIALLSREIADGIGDEVDVIRDRLGQHAVVDLDEIAALNDRAVLCSELGELLDMSSQRSLHPVLSPMVKTQLEALAIKADVLVVGTREVSYELLPLGIEHFRDLVDDATLAEVQWPLLVFRIPHPPLDWPLHHVLSFHEIGHALYREKALKPSLSIPQELKELEAKAPPGSRDWIKARLLQVAFVEFLADWVEELFADLLAALLVGPSYLWAFCRVLAGHHALDIGSKSHPPLAMRIGTISAELEARSLTSGLPERSKRVIDAWCARARAIHTAGTYRADGDEEALGTLIPLMVAACERLIPTIVAQVTQLVGPRVYDSSKLREDIDRGRDLYQLNVPPIETRYPPALDKPGEPLDAPRIFSSCWAGYCHALEAKEDSLVSAEQYGAVLLESLDASEALRLWRAM